MDWLNSPTFPLLPSVPWWGLFLAGFVLAGFLGLLLRSRRKS